jgi:hypothetical protein
MSESGEGDDEVSGYGGRLVCHYASTPHTLLVGALLGGEQVR